MRLLIAVLLCVLIAASAFVYREIAGGDPDPVALAAQINTFREDNQLTPLLPHPLVMSTAQRLSETSAQNGTLALDEDAVMDQLKAAGYVPVSYHILEWQGYASVETEFNNLIDQGYRDVLLEPDMTQIGIGATESGNVVYYTLIVTEFSACDPATQELVESVQRQQAEAVLRLTNDARTREGMGTLALNNQLYEAALWYSNDMKRYGYPTQRPGGEAHIGTDGSDVGERVRRTGYRPVTAGENILMREDMDAAGAFDMWWNSPPHKENILTAEFTQMGLAFTCNEENGQFYYTQVFGTPIEEMDEQTVVNNVLNTVNSLRREKGLPNLKLQTQLSQAAENESAYVVQHWEFRPTIWDDVKTTGYRYEDILVASFTGDSMAMLNEQLSERGQDTLLSEGKTDIGIGVNRTPEGHYNVVIFVARPQ